MDTDARIVTDGAATNGVFAAIHPLGFRETISGAYVKTNLMEVDVRPGPCIGQDNEYVFTELPGLSKERSCQLKDQQVIY